MRCLARYAGAEVGSTFGVVKDFREHQHCCRVMRDLEPWKLLRLSRPSPVVTSQHTTQCPKRSKRYRQTNSFHVFIACRGKASCRAPGSGRRVKRKWDHTHGGSLLAGPPAAAWQKPARVQTDTDVCQRCLEPGAMFPRLCRLLALILVLQLALRLQS